MYVHPSIDDNIINLNLVLFQNLGTFYGFSMTFFYPLGTVFTFKGQEHTVRHRLKWYIGSPQSWEIHTNLSLFVTRFKKELDNMFSLSLVVSLFSRRFYPLLTQNPLFPTRFLFYMNPVQLESFHSRFFGFLNCCCSMTSRIFHYSLL